MAFKLAPRTRQFITTIGEIDVAAVIDLGLVTNPDLNTFVATTGDGNQTIVCIVSGNGQDWQESVVTVDDASPDTLTVNSIIVSSIAGVIGTDPITLAGTSKVFGIIPTNFNLLFDSLFGATNAMLLARIGGSWSGLAPGADGKLLSIVSGALAWVDPTAVPTELGDLSDVVITSPTVGDILVWNGSEFENVAFPSPSGNLDDLGDVVITSPTIKSYLRFDGTNWIDDDVGYFKSLLVEDENNANGTTGAIDNYVSSQNPATAFPIQAVRQYRGTKASPSAVQTGTVLGAYVFDGYNGSAAVLGAAMQAVATENWTGSARGTKLRLSSTPNGSTTAVYSFELDENGNLFLSGGLVFTQSTAPYPIAFSAPQTAIYSANQVIGSHRMACAGQLPANCASYGGMATTAGGSALATANTIISIERSVAASPLTFSQIATVTIGAGTVGVSAKATAGGVAISLAADDVIRAVMPASPDATFAGAMLTLAMRRT